MKKYKVIVGNSKRTEKVEGVFDTVAEAIEEAEFWVLRNIKVRIVDIN